MLPQRACGILSKMVSPESLPIKVLLAQPRAFCAGVERAIRITKELQSRSNQPVYVYHQIVHNKHVVRDLEGEGTVFVDDIGQIPDNAPTVFSAHGVSPEVRIKALDKRLLVEDATCPLVDKVHREIRKYVSGGREVILIGHAYHDETVGTIGEAPDKVKLVTTIEDVPLLQVADPGKLALVTQTTLSLDDAKVISEAILERFPAIAMSKKEDICYATQNRQNGVKAMVELGAEVILILGSLNSSNSVRLQEVSMNLGTRAYLFDDVSEFSERWILNTKVIGITAGASASDCLVQQVVDHLRSLGIKDFEEITVAKEGFSFK